MTDIILQGNQLRNDLNVIVGTGKNWSLPFLWAPLLRYITGPILAIITSLTYPGFKEVDNDPIYVFGFVIAHFTMVLVVLGFLVPRWFNPFIVPERRDEWKQPYAPNQLRGITDAMNSDAMEAGSGHVSQEGEVPTPDGKEGVRKD